MDRTLPDAAAARVRAHSVHIEGRALISITAVRDVESFNDAEIELVTDSGDLRIEGNGLHITRLSLDDGQVVVEGELVALEYSDTEEQRGSLFSRMFR